MTPNPSTALSWCDDCRRYTAWHLLVHQLEQHAPRIGNSNGRRYPDRSWRTAVLQERAA